MKQMKLADSDQAFIYEVVTCFRSAVLETAELTWWRATDTQ